MTKRKKDLCVAKLGILDRIWGDSPAMDKESLEGSGGDSPLDTDKRTNDSKGQLKKSRASKAERLNCL